MTAQTEADQQALSKAALDQMADLNDQMQARLDAHVNCWNRQVSDALNTTQLAISRDLTDIRSSVRRASWARWRWMVWPPLASLAFSTLILLLTVWAAQGLVQGIPATQMERKGQTMQVLTGSDWTTCQWNGHKQPCRPTSANQE